MCYFVNEEVSERVRTDAGTTRTCRGTGALNDRVVCIYSPGAGYIGIVTEVVAD